VWGMKITALEESADFATLDTEKLFGKLKSHELSQKGHPNHDDSFTSKALITSVHVGVHDANSTIDISYIALQAHKIIIVALHRGILHISYLYFTNGGRISIMSKTNIESNSNEYY
jgi:hypothetical protein